MMPERDQADEGKCGQDHQCDGQVTGRQQAQQHAGLDRARGRDVEPGAREGFAAFVNGQTQRGFGRGGKLFGEKAASALMAKTHRATRCKNFATGATLAGLRAGRRCTIPCAASARLPLVSNSAFERG